MTPRTLTSVVLTAAVLAAPACRRTQPFDTIHASGHIEATEVRLAAKIGGRLAELTPREGDRVTAGQIVARIDAVDVANDLARACAEAEVAAARLALLRAGTRKEDIARAEAELARVEADLAGTRIDLDRIEGLASRGTATTKARDDIRTRVNILGKAAAAARAEVDKAHAGPRREEIAQASAQEAAANAAVATLEQRVADCTVTAPRNGAITQRAAEPGEIQPPGGLLLVLTDVTNPWLEVWVDEPSLPFIHLGDEVRVHIDGQATPHTGTVSFVSPTAEFTPKNVQTPEERAKLVFRVKVALANPDGVFKPGMPADAFFARTGAAARGGT